MSNSSYNDKAFKGGLIIACLMLGLLAGGWLGYLAALTRACS